VKYVEGKESEVRALLQQHDIQVVDVLVDQSVLIVTGDQSELDKLANYESVEYTEPEPMRRLLSQ
ncbi:ATPase, partial [Vibrio fortis]